MGEPAAVRLHVEEHGTGPVVVLQHGFAGSARNLKPQARALREDHRVVLFDARGHARSEAPADPDQYTPEAFVSDLHSLVERTGADKVALGGVSMGAGIALRYALAHPERVYALILAAFPPGGDPSRESYWTRFASAIERAGVEAAGSEFVWGHDRFDEKSRSLIRQGFLEHEPHALVAILRRTLAVQPSIDQLTPELEKFFVPSLVIVGKNDTPSVAPSEALAAALPNARLVEVPDAGHIVNLEKPESFNEAACSFLREVEAR